MATQTSICNRAIQLVGGDSITSITENSRSARALNTAYHPVKERLLAAYPWSFAIRRASLAASATPPSFGFANAFPLPVDYLTLLPPDPFNVLSGNLSPIFASAGDQIDWTIESGLILTNDGSPLDIRYVSKDVNESQFHPLFAEAFSADLAFEVCEQLTQSNTKKADCAKAYDDTIELAKNRNAFEKQPARPPLDSWISLRS